MNRQLRLLIIAIGSILMIAGLWFFRQIVVYIIISVVLSIIGRPLVTQINRIKLFGRNLSTAFGAAVTLALYWFLFVLVFYNLIPLLAYETKHLAEMDYTPVVVQLQQPIFKLKDLLQHYGINLNYLDTVVYFREKLESIMSFNLLPGMVSGITDTIKNFGIALFSISFFTFFFLKDHLLFKNIIMAIVPDRYVGEVEVIMNKNRNLLTRYFIGMLIDVLAVFSVVTIGLLIIGISIENAVLCGAIVGLLNIIPFIGSWIGGGIAIIINYLDVVTTTPDESGLLIVVGILVSIFVAKLLDDAFFQPIIYSTSVNAHPLEIFVVILMAGSFSGIWGMILAIPAYTVMRVIAKEFFGNFKLIRKLTKNI